MKKVLLTAGYCGLACKSCSVYIASMTGGEKLRVRAEKAGMTSDELYCKGCRSEKTSPYCTSCNIKKCIREKNYEWCCDCPEYPCSMLKDFQASLPHRAEILKSLELAKIISPEEWEKEMEKDFACENCGNYNSVYEDGCPHCGNRISNKFSDRHWDEIKDSPERDLIKSQ